MTNTLFAVQGASYAHLREQSKQICKFIFSCLFDPENASFCGKQTFVRFSQVVTRYLIVIW